MQRRENAYGESVRVLPTLQQCNRTFLTAALGAPLPVGTLDDAVAHLERVVQN